MRNARVFSGKFIFCLIMTLSGGVTAELASADCVELPDGWFVIGDAPDAFSIEWTESAAKEGRGIRVQSDDRSWRFTDWTQGDRYRFSGVGQRISAMNYRGERVRLRGYLRPQSVKVSAGLWLRADSEDGDTVALDNMWNRPVKATRAWRQYEVVVDVPEGAKAIAFGAHLSGEGALDIDRLDLEIVDKDEVSLKSSYSTP